MRTSPLGKGEKEDREYVVVCLDSPCVYVYIYIFRALWSAPTSGPHALAAPVHMHVVPLTDCIGGGRRPHPASRHARPPVIASRAVSSTASNDTDRIGRYACACASSPVRTSRAASSPGAARLSNQGLADVRSTPIRCRRIGYGSDKLSSKLLIYVREQRLLHPLRRWL